MEGELGTAATQEEVIILCGIYSLYSIHRFSSKIDDHITDMNLSRNVDMLESLLN